jgi:hypothetical protein
MRIQPTPLLVPSLRTAGPKIAFRVRLPHFIRIDFALCIFVMIVPKPGLIVGFLCAYNIDSSDMVNAREFESFY